MRERGCEMRGYVEEKITFTTCFSRSKATRRKKMNLIIGTFIFLSYFARVARMISGNSSKSRRALQCESDDVNVVGGECRSRNTGCQRATRNLANCELNGREPARLERIMQIYAKRTFGVAPAVYTLSLFIVKREKSFLPARRMEETPVLCAARN